MLLKKIFFLLSLTFICIAMMSGCGPDKKEEQPVRGEIYDSGTMRVLVPEGWGVLPRVIDKNGTKDPHCLSIIKGGVSKEGLFEKPQKNSLKPHILLRYNSAITDEQAIALLKQDQDRIQEAEDLQPLKLGKLSWHGFTAEAVSPMHGRYMHYGKHAYLWAEDGKIQYHAMVKFKYDGKNERISLKDRDVQAILASVERSH